MIKIVLYFFIHLIVFIHLTRRIYNGVNANVSVDELTMVEQFGINYGVNHWVLHYIETNIYWKKLWLMAIKRNAQLGYFVANNLYSTNSKNFSMNSATSYPSNIVTLHLYIHDDLQHIKRLLEYNKPSYRNLDSSFNSSIDIWLIRNPESIEKSKAAKILEGVKIDKNTKIFYYFVGEYSSIEVYDTYKMHENSSSILSQNSIWNPDTGFQQVEKSVWSTPRSLNGLHIRVLSAYSAPSVTYIEDGCTSNDCFKGIFADVWHTLSQQLNFTYTVKRAYKWGSLSNGSWDGMVGMLKDDIADVAAADLTVSSERGEAVDFLPVLMEITEELYMKNPGDTFSFVSYLGSFTMLSWIAIALWAVLVPILIFGMMCQRIYEQDERLTLINSYVFVSSTLINLGCSFRPSKFHMRIAFGTVLLGGMLIFHHWEAELTSHLAFKKTNLPINSLKDLSQNSKFKFVVAQGTVHLDYFKYSNDPVKSKIWSDKLEPNVNDLPLLEEIEDRIMEDPFTIAYSDSITKMTPGYVTCKIIDIRPPIRNTQLAYATQKDSPLFQILKYHISNIKQVGLVQKYIRNYKIDAQKCRDYSGRSVTIQQCYSAFQILIAGMLVSLFGFFVEMIQPPDTRKMLLRSLSLSNKIRVLRKWYYDSAHSRR